MGLKLKLLTGMIGLTLVWICFVAIDFDFRPMVRAISFSRINATKRLVPSSVTDTILEGDSNDISLLKYATDSHALTHSTKTKMNERLLPSSLESSMSTMPDASVTFLGNSLSLPPVVVPQLYASPRVDSLQETLGVIASFGSPATTQSLPTTFAPTPASSQSSDPGKAILVSPVHPVSMKTVPLTPIISTTIVPQSTVLPNQSTPSVVTKSLESILTQQVPTSLKSIETSTKPAPKTQKLPEEKMNKVLANSNISHYMINLPGCKIKFYDPFDQQVIDFFTKTTDLECKGSFIFANGSELKIDKNAMSEKWNITKDDVVCRAYEVVRKGEGYTDELYDIEYLQEIYSERFNARQEFVEIICRDRTGKTDNIYEDFFAFIHPKEDVERRCKAAKKSLDEQKKQFSVTFVLLDSVSHRNFLRHFPRTYKELRENFEPLEYNGYTRLGVNTFPCLLPLLTGKLEQEIIHDMGPFDNLSLIWKNFSRSGYRTLFAEDWPMATMFNYLKYGFYFPPTDYYLRPFSLAAEKSQMRKLQNEYCFNSRTELSVNLELCKEFLTVFSDKPVISFTFTTRLTHDYLNYAGYADEPMYDFVHWYKTSSARVNTFLILFSDHGLRYGSFRETDMGTQEESLPFFILLAPQLFHVEYPQLFANLKLNRDRLMTMFDVHEMLKDILNFTGIPRKIKPNVLQRGISLFDEIPVERTCEDAGIGPEFCVCHERKHVDVNSPLVDGVAKILVEAINKKTEAERTKCALLKLQTVISANVVKVTKRSKQNRLYGMDSYKLKVRTLPGEGLFEGVVLCEVDSISECSVQGTISRINKYGSQSSCVYSSDLRNYCYCLQQLNDDSAS